MLVDVVNEIEDATLRRVMVFYMEESGIGLTFPEELLSACFKDYIRTYDPKKEPLRQGRGRYPRLSEEQLSSLIPYFSVVQNLRDTAKEPNLPSKPTSRCAILRKIELEAKASDTAADLTQSEDRRTLDEVRLKEELRHARLLADTLQARTIELEKTRLGLEEQVRRGNLEREKEELAKKRLGNEVRRLRADAEMVRIAKASMDAERQASVAAASAAATGRRSGAGAGTSASSNARPESARARPTTSSFSSFGRAPRLDPFGGSRSSTGQEPTPRRTTGPGRTANTERQRRPEPRAPQRRPVGAAGPAAAPRTEVEATAAGAPDAEDGSLTFVVVVVAIEWLERQEWPALAMLGLANSVVTIGLLALVRQRKIQWPTKPNQRIWLFARGVSSVFALAFAVLATFFDCPAGDTMAISSTNVFASAVLGCLLFGEAFGKLKIASVFVTTFGAVLVAKPEFIFTSVTEQPYLGYIFAAASGLGLSGIIVCCRKLGNEVSPVISAISSTSQRGASLLLLAVLPLWERDLTSSMEKLSEHAGWAVLWVLGVAIVLAVQATLLSLGSSMAPAGASGVVVTCGDIFFGYIGQILVFGILPDAVTLAGVVLLVGSVLMIMMDTVTARSSINPVEPEATKPSDSGSCGKDTGSPPEEVCKDLPDKATTSNASDSLTALRADGRSPQNHSRKTSNASTSSIRGPGRPGYTIPEWNEHLFKPRMKPATPHRLSLLGPTEPLQTDACGSSQAFPPSEPWTAMSLAASHIEDVSPRKPSKRRARTETLRTLAAGRVLSEDFDEGPSFARQTLSVTTKTNTDLSLRQRRIVDAIGGSRERLDAQEPSMAYSARTRGKDPGETAKQSLRMDELNSMKSSISEVPIFKQCSPKFVEAIAEQVRHALFTPGPISFGTAWSSQQELIRNAILPRSA
eukprot:s551_g11.t2